MSNFLKVDVAYYKWVVLICFSMVVIMIQVLWLNFVPVLSFVSQRYDVSDTVASFLVLVFPVFYIIFSFPAGILIDKYGYKRISVIAALCIGFFSLFRCYDRFFYILLIGQCGVAIAQPFVMNALSALVVDWFPKQQCALATGVITAGIFVGMGLGLGVTPALINVMGFGNALSILGGASGLVAVVFAFSARTNKKRVDSLPVMGGVNELFHFFKHKVLLIIFVLALLAMGYFNGLISWMQPIMASKGITSEQSGFAGAMIMFGGMIGSLIFPSISDKVGKRKPFIVTCALVGIFLTWPLYMSSSAPILFFFCCLLGMFFLPGYSLLLTLAEEWSSEKEVARVTSVFMLCGNAGGAIVIALMPLIRGDSITWNHSVYFLLFLLVAAFFLAFKLKDVSKLKDASV